jgi:hypothetical protein
LFAKANERLNEIPEGAEAELVEKHKDEIVSVTKDLMQAFLLDEKACQLNQRILKLAEQYELFVQTNNPEGTSTSTVDSEEEGAEQQNTIYTRDSVIFGKYSFHFKMASSWAGRFSTCVWFFSEAASLSPSSCR